MIIGLMIKREATTPIEAIRSSNKLGNMNPKLLASIFSK
jgi:hypothetical protein